MDFSAVKHTLCDLKDLLNQLSDAEYIFPVCSLGDSTVGEHTRHIIELFQCLLISYQKGILNYDNRSRNRQIETETHYAITCIDAILESIEKENKNIALEQTISGNCIVIETNYFREVLYNLEHCIHHQALIKVAAYHLENITVHENFGVAPSTIEYRKQCVQ
ncbi:DinB family protein [Flavobacterium sp.]|uniref:DinB family protein n=1 Tax=Flavobacterium sp. TaxID=239 RepID=UPI003D6B8CD1